MRTKKWLYIATAFFTVLGTAQGTLLNIDFENGKVGYAPRGAARAFPSSPKGLKTAPTDGSHGAGIVDATSQPFGNRAGAGNAVRIFDYSTASGTSLEYNFSKNVTAAQLDFDLHLPDPSLNNTTVLRTYVTPKSRGNEATEKNYAVRLQFRMDGSRAYLEGDGASHTPFDRSAPVHVSLLMNDSRKQVFDITGPDGRKRQLGARASLLYINGELAQQGTLRGSSSGSLGRVGWSMTGSGSGTDAIIDNITATELTTVGKAPEAVILSANELLRVDFENNVSGSTPAGAACVSPAAPSGDKNDPPAKGDIGAVVTGDANKAVRLYDYTNAGGATLEYNLTRNASAIRLDYTLAVRKNVKDSTHTLRSYVSPFSTSRSPQEKLYAARLQIRMDGSRINLDGGNTSEQAKFNSASPVQISLFLNDSNTATYTITGPDGAERILESGTALLYINKKFALKNSLRDEVPFSTGDASLGRIGWSMTGSGENTDVQIDDIRVTELTELHIPYVEPPPPPPRDDIVAILTTAPPVIDGVFSDLCWKNGKGNRNFYQLRAHEPAQFQTAFQVMYDAENLYIAALMSEPEMEKLITNIKEYDGEVSRDDCIEIYIDPLGTGKLSYRLVINSEGIVFDSDFNSFTITQDYSWSADATVAAKRNENAWTVEAAIPWARMKAGISTSATMNIARTRRAGGTEYSTFSALETDGKFNQPERFTHLVLEQNQQPAAVVLQLENAEPIAADKTEITFSIDKAPAGNPLILAFIKKGGDVQTSDPVALSSVLKNGKGTLIVDSEIHGDCTVELMLYNGSDFNILASSSTAWNLSAVPETEPETRGVWFLYNRSASTEKAKGTRMIAAAMKRLADNNFNQITVELKDTSGNAWWPSKFYKNYAFTGDWDPLQITIDEAKKYGIKVYAWFDIFPEGKYPNRLRGVLADNPAGAMIDRDGEPVGWLCPNQPRTREHITAYLHEVVSEYDVDGMVLDYFRFPSIQRKRANSCFCPDCDRKFKAEYGLHIKEVGDFDERFVKFRQDSIDPLFEECIQLIRDTKPEIPTMMYLGAYSSVIYRAQNWPTWVKKGLLDIVCISGYQAALPGFIDVCRRSRLITKSSNPDGRIYIAQGIHSSNQKLNSSEEVIERIEKSREEGAEGQVLFYYKALLPFIDDVGKTCFARPAEPETVFTHKAAE